MINEGLRSSIVTRIIELEKKNIYNGYSKAKEAMIEEIGNIIREEVDAYENREA
jgi:hypothetical protein